MRSAMTRRAALAAAAVLAAGALACGGTETTSEPAPDEAAAAADTPVSPERPFGQDAQFLASHADTVELTSSDGAARIVVVPGWQGRVMTSTAEGPGGNGFGWINYDLVASGEVQPHINAVGGEDRFWLGPEGGQFAIFFAPGDPFDLEHWQTPAVIDTDAYEVASRDASALSMHRAASLTNYSGTSFELTIDRTVRLLDRATAGELLGVDVPDVVRAVAFESENTITNVGQSPWTRDAGLLSIWILGMFKHSPATTIVVPFRAGPVTELGPVVNDAYFGKVPADRLRVNGNVIYFKGDGQYRSKIGLSPLRAAAVAGSYDGRLGALTVVQYTQPEGATDYVNSMWEIQDEPYGGDVVNSYNDGPPEPGASPLGPFYELETSSPAAALAPGAAITHRHRTFHLAGDHDALDPIARRIFGVGIDQIEAVFSTGR